MKKKNNRYNLEFDKFDRKQKRHASSRQKSLKNKYSIYDNFDDDDLDNNSFSYNESDD